MVKGFFILAMTLCFLACKKADDKSCFKSYGDLVEKEIPVGFVTQFRLLKDITYHLYQDSLCKVVIRGGANVVDQVIVSNQLNVLSIMNNNQCDFLRDYDKKIEVDIHYPVYGKIYTENNDSLICEDTLTSEQLHVEQVYGGGGMRLYVNVNQLIVVARHGVGHYDLSGFANDADIRVETNASGNAENFYSPKYRLYQNSTGDLSVNLDSSEADITIKGTGDIIYTGTPDSLKTLITGAGEMIKK